MGIIVNLTIFEYVYIFIYEKLTYLRICQTYSTKDITSLAYFHMKYCQCNISIVKLLYSNYLVFSTLI